MTIAALFGGDPVGVKNALFDLMRQHGAAKLEADYSGGNDEGGTTDIRLIAADGSNIPAPENFDRDPDNPDDLRAYKYNALWEAVDEVLALEFGSWAGEFEAYGTLYADASTREVRREGGLSSGYDDDSGYF